MRPAITRRRPLIICSVTTWRPTSRAGGTCPRRRRFSYPQIRQRGCRPDIRHVTLVPMNANTLRLRSPADVVSAIPYLIGFHPADSVVVLACDGARGAYAVRLDVTAQDALLE